MEKEKKMSREMIGRSSDKSKKKVIIVQYTNSLKNRSIQKNCFLSTATAKKICSRYTV